MAKKLIRNNVVQMDWDAETFYESKKNGFIAAIHQYEGSDGSQVPVVFSNQKAFLLVDDETGEPASVKEIFEALQYANKLNEPIDEVCVDNYVELSNSVTVEEDTMVAYGISLEYADDIINRLDDLSGYYAVIEEEIS